MFIPRSWRAGRRLPVLMLSLGLCTLACGGGGGQATFQSAANGARYTFGPTDADGTFLGVLGLENAAENFTYYSSHAGYLQVTLTARLNGANGSTGDLNGFGVGPFSGHYDFAPPGRRVSPVAERFFVDQWSYTGSSAAPVHIAGHIDQKGREGEKVDTLQFDLDQACEASNALLGILTCGGRPLEKDFANGPLSFVTGPHSGMAGCPAELLKAFVGGGEGTRATYRYPGDLQFTGASERLSCVTTKGGQAVQCGAGLRTLTAAGCSWKAQALVTPHFDIQRSKHVLVMFVGATTDSAACAPQRACNSEFVAIQQ